ncbi:hypothetical protein [Streptomyces cirratus]|uniref:hypothetical protein n=1 Tax=Streptomyces cirratus TaxID=68187 RepID=UPI00167C5586|nr:hypothetical protein [Streptomyces cirratus]
MAAFSAAVLAAVASLVVDAVKSGLERAIKGKELPFTLDVQRESAGDCPLFLVQGDRARVQPPRAGENLQAWARTYDATPMDQEAVTLTVQGRSPASVVLKDARLRITERSSPVKGTVFAPGAFGCGGTLEVRTFRADLDTSRITPVENTPNFPYKTSENDPEVFAFVSSTNHCVCSWYLDIDWESGTNAGTVTVDDHGRPFRLVPAAPSATIYRLGQNRRWTTGSDVPSN